MLTSRFLAWQMRRLGAQSLALGDPSKELSLPEPHVGRRDLLYIHVPFCAYLCPFCTFHRVLLKGARAAGYFAAVQDELRRYRDQGFEFSAVYVGGGTPTILPEELCETLDLIHSLFKVDEISVETNPNHLEARVLEPLRAAGVNRLSVGVQSFDDVLLREMGRYDAYGSSTAIRDRLGRTSGQFDTLNVDMIFNFPHQSFASVDRDIDILTQDLAVDQVSFYPLMPSSGTRNNSSQTLGTLTFAREPRFYALIRERMSATHSPSSVWCFSKTKQMIDEYIVEHDNYIGVGSGAFSYVDGAFYSTSFSISHYVNRINSGGSGVVRGKRFTRLEQMRYDFLVKLFGMRLDGEAMAEKYGSAWQRDLWKELLIFRLLGAIGRDGNSYRLLERGMYYWLVMMREFLSGVNQFRNEMRSNIKMEPIESKSAALNVQRQADRSSAAHGKVVAGRS